MLDLLKKNTNILACPSCRGNLEHSSNMLKCILCNEEYPIKHEIPIFIKKQGNEVREKL